MNLATSLVGILGKARKQAGWARANPVPGDFGCSFGCTITMFATPDGLMPLVSFLEFLIKVMMDASAANAVIVHPNEHSFLYIKHTVVLAAPFR